MNIGLRDMTMKEADKMLEWKNYPETRKFAIVSHDEINREDHLKWLEKNIQHFQTVYVEGQIAGAIRVYDNEISIWIDRAYWGQGVATQVIKMASQKGFRAKIVNENIASMRAFIKAGYRPASYQGNYYIYEL